MVRCFVEWVMEFWALTSCSLAIFSLPRLASAAAAACVFAAVACAVAFIKARSTASFSASARSHICCSTGKKQVTGGLRITLSDCRSDSQSCHRQVLRLSLASL